MDIRLKTILNKLEKLDQNNPLNKYEYGEDFVTYFHTHQNKDMEEVVKFVEEITEDCMNDTVVLTSNEELYKMIKLGLEGGQPITIGDGVKDVKLVDSIHSTKVNYVDVVYGDIIWSSMDDGRVRLVFGEIDNE